MRKGLLLCLLPLWALAQNTREFSVATYNSLRYSPSNVDARHPQFRTIINDLNPDILVMQELSGAGSPALFLDSVMNYDSITYQAAPFTDGYDLDAALFFKSSKFSVLSTKNHITQLRDIFEYQVLPKRSKDTLTIFCVHLKASSGSTNENRRAAEVANLRAVTDALPDSSNFMVLGDFNIYGSDEPAYQDLLANTPGNQGHFVDKINITGTWNNPNYAQHHTQSPRTTRFNGGAHGGMDDRFDMILFSEAVDAPGGFEYVPNSMNAFGNDGLHYNKAIVDAPANAEVSAAVAQALHLASDHLPVIARFSYELKSGVSLDENDNFQVSVYHNSRQAVLNNPQNLPLQYRIYNLQGQLISTGEASSNHQLPHLDGQIVVIEVLKGEEVVLRSKTIL